MTDFTGDEQGIATVLRDYASRPEFVRSPKSVVEAVLQAERPGSRFSFSLAKVAAVGLVLVIALGGLGVVLVNQFTPAGSYPVALRVGDVWYTTRIPGPLNLPDEPLEHYGPITAEQGFADHGWELLDNIAYRLPGVEPRAALVAPVVGGEYVILSGLGTANHYRAYPAICPYLPAADQRATPRCAPGTSPTPGSDFLESHGWPPTSPEFTAEQVTVGYSSSDGGDRLWQLRLEASREVGLDFSRRMGRDAVIFTYDVDGAAGSVMLIDDQVAGAWLVKAERCIPGIFGLSVMQEEIADC